MEKRYRKRREKIKVRRGYLKPKLWYLTMMDWIMERPGVEWLRKYKHERPRSIRFNNRRAELMMTDKL